MEVGAPGNACTVTSGIELRPLFAFAARRREEDHGEQNEPHESTPSVNECQRINEWSCACVQFVYSFHSSLAALRASRLRGDRSFCNRVTRRRRNTPLFAMRAY